MTSVVVNANAYLGQRKSRLPFRCLQNTANLARKDYKMAYECNPKQRIVDIQGGTARWSPRLSMYVEGIEIYSYNDSRCTSR